MSDYSSRNGDALSQNGYANTSNPSLVPSLNAAASPVIRKKLMGFVGFSNLPNQVHRKSVRKGFQFTAMVVGKLPSQTCRHVRKSVVTLILLIPQGESGLGKSTLINTLFNTKLYQPKEPLPPSAERPKTVAIESISAGSFSVRVTRLNAQRLNCDTTDIEENGVRLRLTVVDTPGFGDFVNNDERLVFCLSPS